MEPAGQARGGEGGGAAGAVADLLALEGEDLSRLGGVTVRRVRRGRETVRLEFVDVPRLGLLVGERRARERAWSIARRGEALAGAHDRGVRSQPRVVERIEDGSRVGIATVDCPRSAADLVRSRVRLDEAALSRIMAGVVDALGEWRRVGGRGHGNLAPESVLLTSRNPLDAEIRLTNPAPDPTGIEPGADGIGLGRLLHALVTHEVVRAGEPRVEWPARIGPAWRELRDELLRGAGEVDYEDLVRRIRALRPRRRGRVAIPAASLLVLGVLAGLWIWLSGEPRMVFDERIAGEWRELCIESGDWYLRFLGEVDREAIAADPHMQREVLAVLREAEAEETLIDPRAIVGVAAVGSWRRLGEEWETLLESPPDARATHEAYLVFDRVRDGLEEWPLRDRAETLAAAFEARGWGGSAAYLRDLGDGAAPGAEGSVGAAASVLPGVVGRAREIESGLETIGVTAARLRESGDPLLSRFGEVAVAWLGSPGQEPGEAGLQALGEAVDDAVQLASDLEGAAVGRLTEVDRPLLAEEFPAYQRLGEPLGANGYRTWLTVIAEPVYTRLDPATDPHPAMALLSAAAGVRGRLDAVLAQLDEDPEAVLADRSLSALGTQLSEARDRAWNRRTRDEVEAAAGALQAELASIEDVVEGIEFDLATPIATFAGTLAGEEGITGSDRLNRAWRERRAELLGRFTAESDLRPLRRASDRLRMSLRELDGAMPPTAPDAGAIDWMTDGDVLLAGAAERREAFIGEALGILDPVWDGERYAVTPEVSERLTAVCEGAGVWRDAALAMCADLAAARRSILAFEGLSAVDGLVGAWEPRTVFEESRVRDAATDLFSMLDSMREVAESSDRAVLAGAAEEAPAPVAHAAWLRLSSVEPAWPTLAGEIQRENTIRRLLKDGADSPIVEADLARLGHERWSLAMGAASSVDEFAVLVVLAPAFDVRTGDLPADVRFNYELFRLDSAVRAGAAGGDERALSEAVDGFLRGTSGFEAELDEGARDLIESLRRAAAVDRPVSADPTVMGPGGAGWRGTASSDRSDVTFTRRIGGEAREISFTVVLPSDGSGSESPVYLAKHEVSLELFQAIVDRARAWEQLASEWVDYDDLARGLSDTWEGPRGWGVRAGGFARSAEWLFVDPTMTGVDPVAPDIDRAINLPPAPDHPMQYVSPRAARMASELIGCRLPTAGEWRGASARYESESAGWNLRDETFDRQREHAARLQRMQRGAGWPDRGIYRPDTTDVLRHDARARAGEVAPDGVLWFSEVGAGAGATFKHLIGNVAELVATAEGFAVIGGSSLSDELETPRMEATAIESYNETLGFADVGFRPAFTAPGVIIQRPFPDEVAFLVSRQGYLLKPGGDP